MIVNTICYNLEHRLDSDLIALANKMKHIHRKHLEATTDRRPHKKSRLDNDEGLVGLDLRCLPRPTHSVAVITTAVDGADNDILQHKIHRVDCDPVDGGAVRGYTARPRRP